MGILIKNGNIFDVKIGKYKENDIYIADSKIDSIGKNLACENSDFVIDADGQNIFPGFIDSHSHIGMWVTKQNGNDANECSCPITPLMRAVDGINPKDKYIQSAVKSGFTTAMITPGSGNALAGQATVIKFCANNINDMTEVKYAALKIAFGENPKSVYGPLGKSPSCRMANFGILEEEFSKAVLYKQKRDKGIIDKDLYWETYIPVLNKEIPVKIHAHRADDILSGIRLMNEFKFDYTLDHCTEGYMIADEIAKTGKSVIIGPLNSFKSKQEMINGNINNGKYLYQKGCSVSVSSDHPFTNVCYMPAFVGMMVKEGLDYNEGIRMLTINSAKAIKMDSRIGSIEVGKDADLFICNGDPLELRTTISNTVINGKIINFRCS